MSKGLKLGLSMVVLALFVCGQSWGQVVLSFNFKDGANPYASLTFDSFGNLYGTTYNGGPDGGFGEVFELIPNASGGWTETVLHSFDCCSADGNFPLGGVIVDGAGNVFGTSWSGGANYGTVFELTPSSAGTWTETIIHDFQGTDGGLPIGNLLPFRGNLYGTTEAGGTGEVGVAYELSPSSDGTWKETVLHNFAGGANDGSGLWGALVADPAGNLYGTTYEGGSTQCPYATGCGTVFELSPGSSGWTEKIIYAFQDTGGDGRYPEASLVFDSAGNLFGTTTGGGVSYFGTLFELSPQRNGTWSEKVIYSFRGPDGSYPTAALTLDSSGNLYGTTHRGGAHNYGTIFKVTPSGNSSWKTTVLHSFNKSQGGGAEPQASVTLDHSGNIYTTTTTAGAYGEGTVFEVPH